MDGPAPRQPFLTHLPAKMRYRIIAIITSHAGYVATELPAARRITSRWEEPDATQHMGQAMTDHTPDFTQLDDSALISRRAEMRAELERLPPHSAGRDALSRAYDASTEEIDDRARKAWTHASQGER
jgi:hypothetical protein